MGEGRFRRGWSSTNEHAWTAATAWTRPSLTSFKACFLHDDIRRWDGGNMVEVILVKVAIYCLQPVRRTVLWRICFRLAMSSICTIMSDEIRRTPTVLKSGETRKTPLPSSWNDRFGGEGHNVSHCPRVTQCASRTCQSASTLHLTYLDGAKDPLVQLMRLRACVFRRQVCHYVHDLKWGVDDMFLGRAAPCHGPALGAGVTKMKAPVATSLPYVLHPPLQHRFRRPGSPANHHWRCLLLRTKVVLVCVSEDAAGGRIPFDLSPGPLIVLSVLAPLGSTGRRWLLLSLGGKSDGTGDVMMVTMIPTPLCACV